jgi:hypothetical protein
MDESTRQWPYIGQWRGVIGGISHWRSDWNTSKRAKRCSNDQNPLQKHKLPRASQSRPHSTIHFPTPQLPIPAAHHLTPPPSSPTTQPKDPPAPPLLPRRPRPHKRPATCHIPRRPLLRRQNVPDSSSCEPYRFLWPLAGPLGCGLG